MSSLFLVCLHLFEMAIKESWERMKQKDINFSVRMLFMTEIDLYILNEQRMNVWDEIEGDSVLVFSRRIFKNLCERERQSLMIMMMHNTLERESLKPCYPENVLPSLQRISFTRFRNQSTHIQCLFLYISCCESSISNAKLARFTSEWKTEASSLLVVKKQQQRPSFESLLRRRDILQQLRL